MSRTDTPPPAPIAAIVLTGGRGSRLGGVDKAALSVAGVPIGETVRAAAAAVADTVVTVGPGGDVREDPPLSGPLAGLAAGLSAVGAEAELVVVLACDLPDLDADTLRNLLAALDGGPAGTEAALAVDAAGRDQYLLAAWWRDALARRLSALGPLAGLPVRRLMEGTASVRVPVGAAARDVDTWDDVVSRGPVGVRDLPLALAAGIAPLPTRAVPPLAAEGALAEPLVAADPQPRAPVSAMDGYALRGPGPWRLVDGDRRAGVDDEVRVADGEAVAIATGALAPSGCDRVLRHELVVVAGGVVSASAEAGDTNDLRPPGEDWPAGEPLAPAGTPVDAAVRSVALSGGLASLQVRGPVRARVVTTGDEVLPADTPDPLPRGRIRDTVGPVLPGVLAAAGMWVEAGPADSDGTAHCPDDPDALAALLASTDVEVLVLVGATGRGPADHLRPVLERIGARILVDGVRMRPGGSQIVAALPGGAILLGLPGNPLAAVCAAAVTGRIVVDVLTGRRRVREWVRSPDVAAVGAPGRTRVLPARPRDPHASTGEAGWSIARRARTSHLRDLVGSAGLVVVPEAAAPDGPVELLRWQ